jgi:hypothetical protein
MPALITFGVRVAILLHYQREISSHEITKALWEMMMIASKTMFLCRIRE